MSFQSRFGQIERERIAQRSAEFLWSDAGEPGLEFLKDERKFSDESIRKFELGYMPVTEGHQLSGRVIFPIRDPSGNMVALHSRRVRHNPHYDIKPTWWHERFQKSFYLYGVNLAKEKMRQRNKCLLVEGPSDVIQLASNGIENVIGLCGTKLSLEQLAVMYRYCSQIIILLDRDSNFSGQEAVEKIMETSTGRVKVESGRMRAGKTVEETEVFGLGFDIVKITLPEFCDPDEYVRRHGIHALVAVIKAGLTEAGR